MKTSEVLVEAGQLIISVHKAKDIEKKGMFGKADPYVKLTLGKETTKSETVKTIIILNGILKLYLMLIIIHLTS